MNTLLIRTCLTLIVLFVIYITVFLLIRFFYIFGASDGRKIAESAKNRVLLIIDMQDNPSENQRIRDIKTPVINNINKAVKHSSSINLETICITAVVEKKSIFTAFFLFDLGVKGTAGENIDSAINIKNPAVFRKVKADSFSNNEFETYLAGRDTGKLFITGGAAEICVNYTIQGAIKRGYEVYIIKEAILPVFGEKSLLKMLNKFRTFGAKIISIDEFLTLK